MGLFTFIKGLFAKATELETQVDSFVTDVAKVAPDTATNLRNDLKKVKKVKAMVGVPQAKLPYTVTVH